MSTTTDTLNKVKAVLGLEVKMEQLKMENGTVLEADKFESGEAVFILTEDEKVALPVGEYELEDNRILKVEEEGIIASLDEHEEEEVVEDETTEETEEMEYVSKEEFAVALEEIKAMIEDLKAGYDEKMNAETEEQTSENEEQEELKAELSKPATEPLKHSPEKVADRELVRFAKNRPHNILDTIFQKLNQ